MNSSAAPVTAAPVRGRPSRDAFLGGSRILLADSLFIPTALVVAAYLARRLGPADYGLYVLAAAAGGWVEWVIASMVSRAAIRQVAASDDWQPAATATLRILLGLGLASGALLAGFASGIASAVGAPGLSPLLMMTALGLPVVTAALAHRFILVGLHRFGPRAATGAARWLGRLVLVVALVEAGLGVLGAVAAAVGASLIELIVARRFITPSLASRTPTPWRKIGRMAAPLFVCGLSLRFFERADLVCLQALGGHAADTGLYGAVQNLAMLLPFVVMAFTPVLLASMTRLLASGREDEARDLAREALRGVLWLAPLAAVLAGAATPLALFVFGREYADAGPWLVVLCAGSAGMVIATVASTILMALERVKTAAALAVPVVPLALAGHLAVIPRFGAVGAASVTAVASWVLALASLAVLHRVARVTAPLTSVLRVSGLVALGAWLAAYVPGEGVLLPARLLIATTGVIAVALACGEVRISTIRSLFAGREGDA